MVGPSKSLVTDLWFCSYADPILRQAPGFWYIVAARFLVGLGTAGMPLMLNTILNGRWGFSFSSLTSAVLRLAQIYAAKGVGLRCTAGSSLVSFWAVLVEDIPWPNIVRRCMRAHYHLPTFQYN